MREPLIKTAPFAFEGLTESEDEGRLYFKGLAAPYGVYDVIGDRLVYGCFKKTLQDWAASKTPVIPVRDFEHKQPLGGILEWDDRPDGLHITKAFFDLNTSAGREHASMARNGYLRGMSVKGWILRSEGRRPRLDVKESTLRHVTVTDDPSYPQTSLELIKSLAVQLEDQDLMQRIIALLDQHQGSPGTPSIEDTSRAEAALRGAHQTLTDFNAFLRR